MTFAGIETASILAGNATSWYKLLRISLIDILTGMQRCLECFMPECCACLLQVRIQAYGMLSLNQWPFCGFDGMAKSLVIDRVRDSHACTRLDSYPKTIHLHSVSLILHLSFARAILCPLFAYGRTSDLMRRGHSLARGPEEMDDWTKFYVGRSACCPCSNSSL